MKYFVMTLIVIVTAHARDPFSYAEGYHVLACVQIGILHGQHSFACLYNDGCLYRVCLLDRCGCYEVAKITPDSVHLKDFLEDGHQIVLSLPSKNRSTKKGPSTLEKLKG